MSAASSGVRRGGIAFYMHDLSGGGVERMRLLLIDALRARGRHVLLVVQSADGPLKALLPADLPLVVLGHGTTWAGLPGLVRFLRTRRPDVLVSSLDHNNIAALLAKCFSRTGTRLVMCQHNALSAETALGWKYRLVPILYRLLHRVADGIVAVSNGVADDLSATAGIARRRITTIYNPVIGPGFQERAAPPPETRWLGDRSRPTLVFAGRLTEQKDPRTLLEAFALLLPFVPARLLILGDGPLRAELEETARELGLSGSVSFAGFQSNPLPWISQASALVLSSRYEGLGNVIVEALAPRHARRRHRLPVWSRGDPRARPLRGFGAPWRSCWLGRRHAALSGGRVGQARIAPAWRMLQRRHLRGAPSGLVRRDRREILHCRGSAGLRHDAVRPLRGGDGGSRPG